jgi:hypothetical protein
MRERHCPEAITSLERGAGREQLLSQSLAAGIGGRKERRIQLNRTDVEPDLVEPAFEHAAHRSLGCVHWADSSPTGQHSTGHMQREMKRMIT